MFLVLKTLERITFSFSAFYKRYSLRKVPIGKTSNCFASDEGLAKCCEKIRQGHLNPAFPPRGAEGVLYASKNLSLAALYYSLAPALQLSGVY
jgi:hypothetical protein